MQATAVMPVLEPWTAPGVKRTREFGVMSPWIGEEPDDEGCSSSPLDAPEDARQRLPDGDFQAGPSLLQTVVPITFCHAGLCQRQSTKSTRRHPTSSASAMLPSFLVRPLTPATSTSIFCGAERGSAYRALVALQILFYFDTSAGICSLAMIRCRADISVLFRADHVELWLVPCRQESMMHRRMVVPISMVRTDMCRTSTS